jgi:drug/metabolite transporter (DMT)-like permease
MAQEVQLGRGGLGKVRSFWIGLGLVVVTLGVYYYCWYYFVNDELKDVGTANDDPSLAASSPTKSVCAVLLGGILLVPPLLSIYNYGQRIRRAQVLVGVPEHERISPVVAFLLSFPGGLLIIPAFFHYWYVTKHQNRALLAAGERQRERAPVPAMPA